MFGKQSRILFIAAFGLLLGLLTIAAPALAAGKEKVLYSFCAQQLCPDGSNPRAGLVSDAAGNLSLYGTASYGGNSNCPHGCGTVFELMLVNGKWKQKVLHRFENDGRDGYYPAARLIFDAVGNLYGTTSAGGADGVGTVFELMPEKNGKWKEKILHSFLSTYADGWAPEASVTFDASGNLFGTTISGGAYDGAWGTVFTLKPGAKGHWSEKVIHNFEYNGTDGYNPRSNVIFDRFDNLYGTTVVGGTTTNGTVFEMSPGKDGSWTEQVLYNFTGGSDGSLATTGLIFDAAGSLYSTALAGGSSQCPGGCGTVFKLTPGTKREWTFTAIYSFDQTDGESPDGSLIFDPQGNLYGTTNGGGAYGSDCNYPGCGTVFELTPGSGGTWTETVLHSFNNSGGDGYQPYGNLVMDTAGNLYGTTSSGGAYGYGTVFEVTP